MARIVLGTNVVVPSVEQSVVWADSGAAVASSRTRSQRRRTCGTGAASLRRPQEDNATAPPAVTCRPPRTWLLAGRRTRPGRGDMDRRADVVVVGSGLAGLAAAAGLAGTGRSVVVLEKAERAGGRARTRVQSGFHLNVGAHALYAGGAASRVLRELKVPGAGRPADAPARPAP